MRRVRSSNERFEGRTCIVTGGGRGIGRAIAEALAAEGARIGIFARTRAQCEAVALGIGERAHAVVGDAASFADCEAAVAEISERFGRPSIVIHAAGISPVRQRAEAHDISAFQAIIDVNLAGAFHVARAAAPALLNGGGSIVFVGSVLGTISSPRLAGYGASKAAVVHLTRTLAREWATRNVRVNAVCPGYVETELTAAMLAIPRLREEIIAAIPLGRLAEMSEIVAPTLFMASDEASYITGSVLTIDGAMAA